jgi:tetratricopeptide (TPR) repeat protein
MALNLPEGIKSKFPKLVRIGLVLVLAGGAAFGLKTFGVFGKTETPEKAASDKPVPESAAKAEHAPAPAELHGVAFPTPERLKAAARQLEAKLEELRRVDEHNRDLRNENAHLKLNIEKLKMECSSTVAAVKSGHFGTELDAETGAEIGRTLETIDFRVPSQLLPAQMHTLGVSYFKDKDWERAVVIFNHLVTDEKTKEFRTARNFLLTAVAWYHLDHYKLADTFLAKVLEFPEESSNLKSMAQARLWKAIVAQRMERKEVAQSWLRDLVDHHPHAPETAQVNEKNPNKETTRVPTSEHTPAHH